MPVFRCLTLALSLGATAAAEPVSSVRLEGLRRTNPEVVRRELLLREGDQFEAEAFAESIQRLKNLLIFAEVEGEAAGDGAGGRELRIRLVEKWTLIPIAKFGGGGGTAFVTLGAYDVNMAGRYVELGAQYENLGGISSGVAWFRNPRFLDRRLRLGGDFWKIARNHLFYGPGASREGGYTLERLRFNLFVDKEFSKRVTGGIGWTLDNDQVDEAALSDEVKAENRTRGLSFGSMPRASAVRLYGTLGRLDWDGWLTQGAAIDGSLELAGRAIGGEADFARWTLDGRAFHRIGNHNLGLRLAASSTDAPQLSQEAYLGGLDAVRGYVHERFRGRSWWLASAEARAGLIRTRYFVAQGVGFLDAVRSAPDFQSLPKGGSPSLGSGAGLRLIFPRIYRLNLRLDYGWALDGTERGVSFGLQQFF